MNDNHRPMSTAPKDGSIIQAWHKVWKCWLPITYRDVAARLGKDDGCVWIDATLSTRWPEEAFICWTDPPPAP